MSMDTSHAKIFLESLRGCTVSPTSRSYHTFNFGPYTNKHREPFLSLKTFNDETLAPRASAKYSAVEKLQVVVIPLVGACECTIGNASRHVDAGQIFFGDIHKGQDVEIGNPFQEELINYLYIELNSQSNVGQSALDIDIEKELNTLLKLSLSGDHNFHIGMYNGREEGVLTYEAANKAFFVFIVEGAFEVNNRLLHQRDSLAIWDTSRIEFEALSNNAIILIVEFTPDSGVS